MRAEPRLVSSGRLPARFLFSARAPGHVVPGSRRICFVPELSRLARVYTARYPTRRQREQPPNALRHSFVAAGHMADGQDEHLPLATGTPGLQCFKPASIFPTGCRNARPSAAGAMGGAIAAQRAVGCPFHAGVRFYSTHRSCMEALEKPVQD